MDCLECVSKHLDDPAYQWCSIYFIEINNTYKDLSKVSFKNLTEHYEEVIKKVVELVVASANYISLKASFIS